MLSTVAGVQPLQPTVVWGTRILLRKRVELLLSCAPCAKRKPGFHLQGTAFPQKGASRGELSMRLHQCKRFGGPGGEHTSTALQQFNLISWCGRFIIATAVPMLIGTPLNRGENESTAWWQRCHP
jgi:hypothetical protein